MEKLLAWKKPKQWAGIILGTAIFIIVGFCLTPPEGLTHASMVTIGAFAWAICQWVSGSFTFFMTGMTMILMFGVFGVDSFSVVYSGYSNSTWWFMLGAMGMSAALSNTNLLKRIAFNIMKLFKPTFRGQTAGLLSVGAVITPFIPSITAKTLMGMPIARGVSNEMKYPPLSRQTHGLWVAAFAGLTLTSYMFLNSNFFCYYAYGLMDEAVRAEVPWIRWVLGTLLWGVIVLVGILVVLWIFYKPKEGDDKNLTITYIDEELKKMGPMSGDEKFVMVVFLTCVACWALEDIINIDGQYFAIGAFILFLMTGKLTVKQMRSDIPWDMLMMSGALQGLGTILKNTGVSSKLIEVASPLVASISSNPALFICLVAIGTYIVRYVYFGMMSVCATFLPLLIPLAMAANISPWCVVFAMLTGGGTWNTIYQNSCALQGFGQYGGEEQVNFNKLSTMSYVYCGINLIALLASLPVWRMMGLLG